MYKYTIEFDIVAIIMCVLVLITFHRQKQINTKRNSIFYIIIVFVSLSSLFCLLASLAVNNINCVPLSYTIIVNYLFYFFHIQVPFLFYIYTFVLLDYHHPAFPIRLFSTLSWLLLLFLVLGNPFHKALFTITNEGYVRGQFLPVIHILSFMYLLVVLVLFIANHKKLFSIDVTSFFTALFFPWIASIVQFNFEGLVLESFSFSFSTLFFLLMIQNDKNFIEPTVGLKNSFAFDTILKDRLLQSSAFSIIILHSQDLKTIQTYLDNESYNALLKNIVAWLLHLTKQKGQLFMLSDNLFAIIFNRFTQQETIGELALDIIQQSQKTWEQDEIKMQLSFQLTILRMPNDCNTSAEIHDCIGQFVKLSEIYSDRHIINPKNFIPEAYLRQAKIAYALQEKLENKTLDILYQPILSVNENRIIAFETLVSLSLSDGTLIQQNEILTTAEHIGLGRQLVEYILEKSFLWYAKESLNKKKVNLQILLLESFCFETNWAKRIFDIAEKTKMDMSFLCLQLTETIITNALENIKTNIDFLSDTQVHFAINDFGSGYTDFGEIFEIPFRTVKLNNKIVQNAFSNSTGKQLLEGAISLFRQLNWAIVADGVETKESFEYLKSIGLNYFQGSFVSYPEKAETALLQIKYFVKLDFIRRS